MVKLQSMEALCCVYFHFLMYYWKCKNWHESTKKEKNIYFLFLKFIPTLAEIQT